MSFQMYLLKIVTDLDSLKERLAADLRVRTVLGTVRRVVPHV